MIKKIFMNNQLEFEEKKFIYKPLDDVFYINKVNHGKTLNARLNKLAVKSLKLSAIISVLSLPALYIDQNFFLNIEDYIFYLMLLNFISGFISFLVYSITDSEESLKNKSVMYTDNLLKQAITYSIVAGICLILPSMLVTENRGCFSGYSNNLNKNKEQHIQLDTNQAKDLPEEYYVRTI